jgi:hypothetical protein
VSPRAPRRIRRPVAVVTAAWLALAALVGSSAGPAAAADPPTMTARVLLQGHARLGSWIAIKVHLHNEGPSVTGELRLVGGAQGGTRYSTVVQLDSPSDKDWILYAQPPSFGQQLEVVLASGTSVIARQKVAVTIHEAGQLVVGVVADKAPAIVGSLSLPSSQNQQPAVIVPLTIDDLPTRIEAWSALDRMVWQDVDASTLSSEQMTALRGWLALGGRLVIVGGTAGIGSLSGFPDDILPFRPTSTIDVTPASIQALLGGLPKDATDVPAMSGELIRGRALATSGDRVVAAQSSYGSGSVTILGIDPTVGWIAETTATKSLWPNLIAPRSDGTVGISDDTQIVTAVSNLPSLSLPPLGGLLLLLFGYVALIGPLNYLVLRRLDRREWAWITMPILIVGFAFGAYSFGSALRGSSIIVNEVGIVRGAPDAAEGTAQVYLGVFSPARGTYQIAVPGGALLSSPINGDVFGGQGASLDVLQGDPSRVRDLAVGFGSLRTIRAESAVVAPKVHMELSLIDGILTGMIRNDAATTLEKPALVLGSNVKVFKDLAPGEEVPVSLPINGGGIGDSLANRIFGQVYFDGSVATSETTRRDQTRHLVIDQLTSDPQMNTFGQLAANGPVLLAWGRAPVLDVTVEGQGANRQSNVLYYVPASMGIRGKVAFQGDLLTSTLVETDAGFFSKEPSTFNFGRGSATVSYRPVPFEGRLTVTHVRMQFGFGGDQWIAPSGGVEIKPIPDVCLDEVPVPARVPVVCPKPLPPEQFDQMPEVEVFDRTGKGTWHRLTHPSQGQTYDLANAGRYVDPATGILLVRYVNDVQDQVGFAVNVSIEGTVQ